MQAPEEPSRLPTFVEERPYSSIAAALGLGYVLGGGVFTPLTARVAGAGLRLGLRMIVLPLVTKHLVERAASSAVEPA
ncbi:MAG: hypothetical protein ACAI25_13720 [Planctomycetota bacterium]